LKTGVTLCQLSHAVNIPGTATRLPALLKSSSRHSRFPDWFHSYIQALIYWRGSRIANASALDQ